MRSWSVDGRDLLWSPDVAVWDAVAPILFPVIGWTQGHVIRVDGRTYPMGVHGFAATRTFDVIEAKDDRLILRDRADETTRENYPFEFALEIAFELRVGGLGCTATVSNAGDVPMPYALGLHPGFRWPAGADAQLTFSTQVEPSVPVITADGLFDTTLRPLEFDGKDLTLTRELMSREALCFLDTRSSTFTYEVEDLGALRLTHENFAHLSLWSRPPAPFLCLESWTGHGDPADFAGELADKPSMRILPPGGSARHRAIYDFTAPSA